jgi:hypothetical protein
VHLAWQTLKSGPGRSHHPVDVAATVAFVVGGGLLIWSSAIHFHLWHDLGYHAIATIGPLFLLQCIAGFVLGLGVIALRRAGAAVLGVGFALATVAGFLITVSHGLFGFKDSWQAPFAHEAFGVEIAAAAVLAVAAALCLAGSASRARSGAGAGAAPAGVTS